MCCLVVEGKEILLYYSIIFYYSNYLSSLFKGLVAWDPDKGGRRLPPRLAAMRLQQRRLRRRRMKPLPALKGRS
jgi:hypothetical protein